jgi:hypothetical protein
VVYLVVRGPLQRALHLYVRMWRPERGHVPRLGPVTFAATHRGGDCVVTFPEGTRNRPVPLAARRRGVGRGRRAVHLSAG